MKWFESDSPQDFHFSWKNCYKPPPPILKVAQPFLERNPIKMFSLIINNKNEEDWTNCFPGCSGNARSSFSHLEASTLNTEPITHNHSDSLFHCFLSLLNSLASLKFSSQNWDPMFSPAGPRATTTLRDQQTLPLLFHPHNSPLSSQFNLKPPTFLPPKRILLPLFRLHNLCLLPS